MVVANQRYVMAMHPDLQRIAIDCNGKFLMTDVLPKTLDGVVCPQMVRCGKVGCKCQQGQLHGPYYYRFFRENGRLRKQYVPRSQLQTVMAQCKQRQLEQQTSTEAAQLAKDLTDSIKQIEESIRGNQLAGSS